MDAFSFHRTPERIKVFVRSRPAKLGSKEGFQVSETELSVPDSNSSTIRTFTFNNILKSSASQLEVFQEVGQDALQTALNGQNATIMCYGQTGAGKTHTMSELVETLALNYMVEMSASMWHGKPVGQCRSTQQRGLIPRVLGQLFVDIAALTSKVITLHMTYVEIYNEAIFDLLDESSKGITIADSTEEATLQGAAVVRLLDEKQAIDTFCRGEAARAKRGHALNGASSRSHAVCTIHIAIKNDPGDPQVVKASLSLVDLAGSERVQKTKSSGLLLREAAHINKSLTFLEQVAIAILEGREHVPYRSSKLTHMLKNALGGNSKTTFIANLWNDVEQRQETVSTMRFAQRIAQLQTHVSGYVASIDHAATIQMYERDVQELKAQLADLQSASSTSICSAKDRARLQDSVQKQVSQFLRTGAEREALKLLLQLELSNADVARAALMAARQCFIECSSKSCTTSARETEQINHASVPENTSSDILPGSAVDEGASAPPHAELSQGEEADAGPSTGEQTVAPPNDQVVPKMGLKTPQDWARVLEEYQRSICPDIQSSLQDRRDEIKQTKKRIKELALQINAEKHKIDQAAASKDVEHHKSVYRVLWGSLQQEKSELRSSIEALEHLKKQMMDKFGSWCQENYNMGVPSELKNASAGG